MAEVRQKLTTHWQIMATDTVLWQIILRPVATSKLQRDGQYFSVLGTSPLILFRVVNVCNRNDMPIAQMPKHIFRFRLGAWEFWHAY